MRGHRPDLVPDVQRFGAVSADLSSVPARPISALALGLGVVLPLVELGRIALVADGWQVAGAAVCMAVLLPLYVWHLHFGLRGYKPPAAGWTLSAMALAGLGGAIVAGPHWALVLASLASSVLIVVDVPWAALAIGATVAGAYGLGEVGASAETSRTGPYVVAGLAFRSVTLFVLVWYSAVVYQLAQARSSIAAAATARERRRADDDVTALAGDVGATLVEHARHARTLLARGERVAADGVLQALAECSRHAMTRVRTLARSLREAPASAAGAANALTLTGAGPASPVERALHDARHSRRVLVAVHVPMIFFLIAMATTGLGTPGFPTLPPVAAVSSGLALGALQLYVSFAVSGRRPPGRRLTLLAAAWTLGLAPAVVLGFAWSPAAWFVAAIGALLLRSSSARLLAFLLPIGLWTANELRQGVDAGAPLWGLAWIGAYTATIGFTGAAGLVAAARLSPLVDGLVAARRAQAAEAGEQERRRISRDLHDLLGQTLSALTLKAELARRWLDVDPDGARREVSSIIDVATDLTVQLDAIVDVPSSPTLDSELGSGASLLRSAGARVDLRLSNIDDLPAPADALLAWTVREGITNILRHSRPRHCLIVADRRRATVRLEIVNDGVAPSVEVDGRGLVNLGERLRAVGGSVRATEADGGRFRLEAEVPDSVPEVPETMR